MRLPKGPFRTKNATTIAKLVNHYTVVFLLRPPDLLRRGPFSERENVCNSQENGVRTRRAAIVNHRAIVKILRVVNLLCVVFLVRRGPLGICDLIDCLWFLNLLSARTLTGYCVRLCKVAKLFCVSAHFCAFRCFFCAPKITFLQGSLKSVQATLPRTTPLYSI